MILEILIISVSALSIALSLLTISLIKTKSKNKELAKRVSNLNEAANESYVKFLSDSRDWAYEYIESVQEKLSAFASKVEPQLKYYTTYGSGVTGPHQILVKELSEAYDDLKTLMPQDNEENK